VTALDENIRRVAAPSLTNGSVRVTSHRHPPTCRATGPQEDLGPARLSLAQKLASIVIPTRAASARQPARRTSDTTQTRPFFFVGFTPFTLLKNLDQNTGRTEFFDDIVHLVHEEDRSASLTRGTHARGVRSTTCPSYVGARRSTHLFLVGFARFAHSLLLEKSASAADSFARSRYLCQRRPLDDLPIVCRILLDDLRHLFSRRVRSLRSLTTPRKICAKAAHSLRSFAVLMPAASARRPAHRMSDTARRFRPPRGLLLDHLF